jgi:rhodanese-related sulfurtransferase
MKNQLSFYESKLAYELDASDLFDALKDGQAIIVIDARTPNFYQTEHIPNAINLPHRTMSESTTAELDKQFLYVVYCDGVGCNASTKGACNLLELGFEVKELIGGIAWWKQEGFETIGTQGSVGTPIFCGC